MRSTAVTRSSVTSMELRSELERLVREHFGPRRHISRLLRRPCPYGSSFALEELDLVLDDGVSFKLMFKDLSERAMSEVARRTKPSFLYDPLREIHVYRDILADAELGTAQCYGTIVDQDGERYWLFIENVAGAALWQIGQVEIWQEAARWIAGLHATLSEESLGGAAGHLQRYDASFYRAWPERAQAFATDIETSRPGARRRIAWLSSRYEQVVERLMELPVTFIHGEFYPSNVLVVQNAETRICPIDWERAAIGPGLVDLAALVTGSWGVQNRELLAESYRAALPDESAPAPDALLEALDYCRLHLAVQLLGWAVNWSPPEEHRQDWLGSAVQLAEELGL